MVWTLVPEGALSVIGRRRVNFWGAPGRETVAGGMAGNTGLGRLERTAQIRTMSCQATRRGCSSVVERHVANVNVVSSNLITRFQTPGAARFRVLSLVGKD